MKTLSIRTESGSLYHVREGTNEAWTIQAQTPPSNPDVADLRDLPLPLLHGPVPWPPIVGEPLAFVVPIPDSTPEQNRPRVILRTTSRVVDTMEIDD